MAGNLYEVIATDGQTVFDLPYTYSPGSNDLFVDWNGLLQYVGVSYTETSPTSVTLLGFSALAGDRFVFRVPPNAFTGLNSPITLSFAPPLPRPTSAPILTFS